MTMRCKYCNRFMKVRNDDPKMNWHEKCLSEKIPDNLILKAVVEHKEEMKEEIEIKHNRGGARVGAGRKSKGVRKPVSINLPPNDWDQINEIIESDTISVSSYAEYFKILHDRARKENWHGTLVNR